MVSQSRSQNVHQMSFLMQPKVCRWVFGPEHCRHKEGTLDQYEASVVWSLKPVLRKRVKNSSVFVPIL